LATTGTIDGGELRRAIETTFAFRNTHPVPFAVPNSLYDLNSYDSGGAPSGGVPHSGPDERCSFLQNALDFVGGVSAGGGGGSAFPAARGQIGVDSDRSVSGQWIVGVGAGGEGHFEPGAFTFLDYQGTDGIGIGVNFSAAAVIGGSANLLVNLKGLNFRLAGSGGESVALVVGIAGHHALKRRARPACR
jgi:hypothetical protein